MTNFECKSNIVCWIKALCSELHVAWCRLVWMYYYSQTTAVRFLFALGSFGFSSFLLMSDYPSNVGSSYILMFALAPKEVWGWAFLVHGLSLWYGAIFNRYNTFLLLTEGVLGVALWTAAGGAIAFEQGAPGGTAACSLISVWLLVRYPTHHEWEKRDAC